MAKRNAARERKDAASETLQHGGTLLGEGAHEDGGRRRLRHHSHPVAAADGLPPDLSEGAFVGAGVAVLYLRHSMQHAVSAVTAAGI